MHGCHRLRRFSSSGGVKRRTEDRDSLDDSFLLRLHSLLDLTDNTGIHVILDNHGDMTGAAGCGNGAPLLLQQQAAADLIGKPLQTQFPFGAVPRLRVENIPGFEYCGRESTDAWMKHSDDPNCNLLNECCQAMNSGGYPGGLGYPGQVRALLDINGGGCEISPICNCLRAHERAHVHRQGPTLRHMARGSRRNQ